MYNLTEFQKDIIYVLSRESMYGLRIKRELEEYYDKDVNHGRLYPNLDKLRQAGYIDKEPVDNRTNNYSLTPQAHNELKSEMEWRISNFVSGEGERKDDIEEIISSK